MTNGKAWVYLRWQGSTKKTRTVLEEGLQNVKSEENADIVNSLVDIDVYDGNYQEALDRLSLKSEDIDDASYFIPNARRYALIYKYMNKNELAKKYYEETRSVLESKSESSWRMRGSTVRWASLMPVWAERKMPSGRGNWEWNYYL
jgi:hypothetical protein